MGISSLYSNIFEAAGSDRSFHSPKLPTASFESQAPIRPQINLRDIAVKTAERPIKDSGRQPVLHRIVVDVIDVALEVGIVADGVLPIAALPDAFLTLGNFARRSHR